MGSHSLYIDCTSDQKKMFIFRDVAKRTVQSASQCVRQSEYLQRNPVSGYGSWYETNMQNNQIYVKVHLQNTITGEEEVIELPADYPKTKPKQFEGLEGKDLKGHCKQYLSKNKLNNMKE